jgi:DNA-binding GntR family transcriptional regulator
MTDAATLKRLAARTGRTKTAAPAAAKRATSTARAKTGAAQSTAAARKSAAPTARARVTAPAAPTEARDTETDTNADLDADNASRRDRNTGETSRRIADQLEDEIVLGVLHPRERLIEDDLCARFDLKRHVARQVLVELEQRGLAERRRNVGAVVKSFSAREVTELYDLRELLETHAASRIPFPVERAQLDALDAIQAQHDAAAQAGDLRRVFRVNMAFHHAFFALCGDHVLVDAIHEYERRTHAIRSVSIVFPQYLERARAEHHQIIAALRHGDRERLIELCRSHLLPSRDAYLEAHHRRAAAVRPREFADSADSNGDDA